MSDLSPEAASLYQQFEIWLLAHRGFAKSTIVNRLGNFRRIIAALGLDPTSSDAERYIADLRQTGASYAHIYNAIVAIEEVMAFLKKPSRIARPRRPHRIMKETLNEAEVAMIIYNARDLRERAILAVLAYSGIRNMEFCNLLMRDADTAGCSVAVHLGKGVQSYKAAITGECVKLLAEYITERKAQGAKDEDFLFVTKRHGHQLMQQDLRKIIRLAAKRARITKRVSPHLFRHSLAMNMLNRGASLSTIQHQLGHNWVQTTMEYLRGDYTRGKNEYPLTAPRYF